MDRIHPADKTRNKHPRQRFEAQDAWPDTSMKEFQARYRDIAPSIGSSIQAEVPRRVCRPATGEDRYRSPSGVR
ncbi:Hypothetical protein A7982_10940 [Minicystis rosea]|nr:Hypothetical protein A7982_10940 [Minicystis rosea]